MSLTVFPKTIPRILNLRVTSSCCHKFIREFSQKIMRNVFHHRQKGCFIQRHLSSASTSFTSLDASDIELAYTTYPQDAESQDTSKRPIIFLHGLFGAKGNLHSVSKHLASDGRKIVTFDARNHGDSSHSGDFNFQCMSADLQDLIQELQLGQPIVMGHSMGGRTAMLSALNEPDNLSSLIIADVTPNTIPVSESNNLKKYAEAMRAAKIPQDSGLSQARKSVQVQLAPAVPSRGVLNFLLTNMRESPDGGIKWRINLEAIVNNFNKITSFPEVTGKSFSKPTLFVFGSNSYHYRSLDPGLVKQLFPSAEIEAIPDAGHFVHSDKPLEFVKVVGEFIKTAER